VEPTNNSAERALRHAVIRRKLCYRIQSEAGSRFMERILTTVETCRQQHQPDDDSHPKRLQEALDRNNYVPAYLLGRKRLPKQLPAYMTWGGEDEAQAYAADARAVWIATSRALKWLNTVWKAHRA
jgi:hypothetical protein